jgi:hypothetical protein
MSAYTLSGKVYTTEDALEAISLDEMFEGRSQPCFEGHVNKNCTLYKSRKGQWFVVTHWPLSSWKSEAKLVTDREAVVLMLNHGKTIDVHRLFGDESMEEMAG